MSKRSRSHRGQSPKTKSENYANTIHSWGIFDNDRANSRHTYMLNQTIDQGVVLDWAFMDETTFLIVFLRASRLITLRSLNGNDCFISMSQFIVSSYMNFMLLTLWVLGHVGMMSVPMGLSLG